MITIVAVAGLLGFVFAGLLTWRYQQVVGRERATVVHPFGIATAGPVPERRRAERYTADEPVWMTPSGQQPSRVTVRDAGEGGMLVDSSVPLQEGETADLRIGDAHFSAVVVQTTPHGTGYQLHLAVNPPRAASAP